MAKAKSKEEYALQWKNEVSAILYGPCADAGFSSGLQDRIRESVTKLCGEIDEVAEQLESEGVFRQE